MTITFFVKTSNTPQTVGQTVCDHNFYPGEHPEDKYSWIIKKRTGEEDYYEIMGKYEPLKDLALIGIVYRAGDSIVLGEIADDLAQNFSDPLLEEYGFENIKWIVVPAKT